MARWYACGCQCASTSFESATAHDTFRASERGQDRVSTYASTSHAQQSTVVNTDITRSSSRFWISTLVFQGAVTLLIHYDVRPTHTLFLALRAIYKHIASTPVSSSMQPVLYTSCSDPREEKGKHLRRAVSLFSSARFSYVAQN